MVYRRTFLQCWDRLLVPRATDVLKAFYKVYFSKRSLEKYHKRKESVGAQKEL